MPLVNKETALGLHRVQRQARKTKQNAGEKEVEAMRSCVAPLELEGTLPGKPQSHGNTQITRNRLN